MLKVSIQEAEQSQTQAVARREMSALRGWAFAILGIGLLGAITATVSQFRMHGKERYPTHEVTRGELVVSITEQGTLESSNNTEIKCRVRGFSTVTWIIDSGVVVDKGDELVRLDTKLVEEQLSLTKTNTFVATSTLERTRADLERAKIAIEAYENGRRLAQLETLEQAHTTALDQLERSQDMLTQSRKLYQRGYASDYDVRGNELTVQQADLETKVRKAELLAFQEFTDKMEMVTLQGNLTAATAKFKSDQSALIMEQSRQSRAQQELADCVIHAPDSGLVIYPSAAAWKEAPDVEQGARVRKNQILLLMPDLSKMQVKVGIHESVVDRVRPGLKAMVRIPEATVEAEVRQVAAVTRPAGWWTGNVVKYDTIIGLPEGPEFKPGMSAEVEIELAVHHSVITVPIAALEEAEDGVTCWVDSQAGPELRHVEVGESNDVSVVVKSGLREGETVILNAMRYFGEDQSSPNHVGARFSSRGASSLGQTADSPVNAHLALWGRFATWLRSATTSDIFGNLETCSTFFTELLPHDP